MAKIDRTLFTTNDQDNGDVADPNKLESNDSHIADVVDANDANFNNHKNLNTLDHPDGSVTNSKIADKSVTRGKVADEAIGSEQLSSSLLDYYGDISVKAEIEKHDKRIENKSYAEGDLVDLLKSHSALKDNVIVKVRDTSTIDIGVFYQENKATIYTMKPDSDGWWRLFDVINRPLTELQKSLGYKKSKNYESKTGTWVTSSPPQYYATEVGSTFSGNFEGSGLQFNHTADDQGGIWEFVIDGYIKVEVSTWASSSIYEVNTEVVKGLANTQHSYVATFKGDDPDNPPSTGAGTSRGWAMYYTGTGTTSKTITPIIPSYENQNGLPVMQSGSRKEFAFNVKPKGANFEGEWVPEHGVMGVITNLSYKIYFGETEITDLSMEPDVYYIYPNVRIVSNFDAKHPSDATILWKGRLDQSINGSGYHIRGRFDFQADTTISLGYPAMLAIDKSATDNDRVVASDGERYVLPIDTNDDSNVVINGDISSVVHFSDSSSSQNALNTVAAMKLYDFKRIMRKGLSGAPENPIVTRLRTDGNRKTYFGAYESYTEQAGTIYDFGVTYFCGEIKDASELLPG